MSAPLFTYNPNVPQSTQYIRTTQAPILSNFQAINELIKVNHVGFNDVNNYGKHNFTSFPFQVSDPNTGPSEIAIYSKATPGGTNSAELFYRYPNNGDVIQLTNSSTVNTNYSLLAQNGYAILDESNTSILWGKATGLKVDGTSVNVVNFPGGKTVGNGYGIYTPSGSFSSSELMYLMEGVMSGPSFVLTRNGTGSQRSGPSVYWIAIAVITNP